MGALHEGHISLVKESLKQNDLTVVSIFVNPAQFAPHEDLDKYPRTFDGDMETLSKLSFDPSSSAGRSGAVRKPSAVFAPTVQEMYPSGISQDRTMQKGTFVEVVGYSHQMEGKTRPDFFRGVTSVVLRLFNAVQPTHAYFGQKDIQQALILRRMVKDTLLSHPTASTTHIVPTSRAPDGLALSSRNAYLSPKEQKHATGLYKALLKGKEIWDASLKERETVDPTRVIQAAEEVIEKCRKEADEDGVKIELDYIAFRDPETFEMPERMEMYREGKAYLLCGAMKLGTTRMIDNIILGKVGSIVY